MNVVYTPNALRDLDEIADWLAIHHPTITDAVEHRIRTVARILDAGPRAHDA